VGNLYTQAQVRLISDDDFAFDVNSISLSVSMNERFT